MPAILGQNLKRKSVFLAPNGQLYEGTSVNYYEGNKTGGIEVGRVAIPDRVSEETSVVEEKKEE